MIKTTSLPLRALIALCLAIAANFAVAQSRIALDAQPVSVSSKALDRQFRQYQVFEFDASRLDDRPDNPNEQFQLAIELPGLGKWTLNLIASSLYTDHYRELEGSDKGVQILPKRKVTAYAGHNNADGGNVALTLTKTMIFGAVSDRGETYYVEPLRFLDRQRTANNRFVIYNVKDLIPSDEPALCGAAIANEKATTLHSHGNDWPAVQNNNDNCVEADLLLASSYDMLIPSLPTTQDVMDYVLSITNVVQNFSDFYPVNYIITDNYVSTSFNAEPFESHADTLSNSVLLREFAFWGNNSSFLNPHDVGQVWTDRNIGVPGNFGIIGTGYLGTVCDYYRYNICENYTVGGLNGLAVLSAHEFGHNWGCGHSDAGTFPNNIMRGFISLNATGYGPNSQARIASYIADEGACLSSCDQNPPPPGPPGCTARSEYPWEEWINDVTIGSLQNLNSGKFRDYNTFGYSDYTDLTPPDLNRSAPVSYQFQMGFSGQVQANNWTAFVDFNQNNVFDLPQEQVVNTSGNVAGGSFTIPADALAGTTRMRIILSNNPNNGPCTDPGRGEVEDYLVNIVGDPVNPPSNLPDLVITNFDVANNGNSGAIIPYTIDIGNQGQSDAGAFILGVYLSTDQTLDNNDVLTGEIPTGNFQVGFFVPDVVGAFDLAGIAPGNYYLIAQIDYANTVQEINENNNTIVTPFVVQNANNPSLPDLTIANFNTADAADPNTIVDYTIDITNQGQIPSGDFTVGVYLSEDFTLQHTDVLVGEIPTGNFPVGFTANDINGSFDLAGITGGNYVLIVKVDAFDQLAETNEFNNIITRPFTVNGGNNPDLPDLTISNFASPSTGMPNTVVDYTINISNQGQAAAGNFVLAVHLSQDNQLDNSDVKIGEIPTGNFAPGFTAFNIGGAFNLNGITPGSYFLIVNVDDNNAVLESNENNNTIVQQFTVVGNAPNGVDLSLAIQSDVAQPNIYSFARMTLTLANTGSQTANNVSVRIAPNTSYVFAGDGNASASTGFFNAWEGTWVVGSIAPNTTQTLSFDLFTLSSGIAVCSEVFTCTEPDVDSTPGNANCPTATEDDEAVFNTQNSSTLTIENVYPNPAVDALHLTVQSPSERAATILIYDRSGHPQLSEAVFLKSGSNLISLSINHLRQGLYFVTIPDSEGGKQVRQVLKR